MILLKETAGDTLVGAIDGTNTTFITSFDFSADSVNVYLNGRLKVRSFDDGFWVVGLREVVMKEPPLLGDTVEVEYRSDTRTGGGALGGVPPPAQVQVLEPEAEGTGERVPEIIPESLEPTATCSSRDPRPGVSSLELRPQMFSNEEDC
jgi:hypothetical protein